jgi:hypothetical protein
MTIAQSIVDFLRTRHLLLVLISRTQTVFASGSFLAIP